MNRSELSGGNALAEASREAAVLSRRLPLHTLSDLLIPLSGAIDHAEGREEGHARRVAYLALTIAGALGAEADVRLACIHAGLFHDVGVIEAGAGLAGHIRGDEHTLFASLPLLTPVETAFGASEAPELVSQRLAEHTMHGARFAAELSLPPAAVEGIASHHENWDGTGYPDGLRGAAIPLVARIVGLADEVEALISDTSPLQARRNLFHWLDRLSGKQADPEIVARLLELASGDGFWLGLFGADLPHALVQATARLRETRTARIFPVTERFAQLVDARFSFTTGISTRVAQVAEALGRCLDLPDLRLKQLRLAAFLHDIGQLAVSERIIAKPGIFSIEEQEALQVHPVYSRDVVAGIAGLEEVADWIGAHHERPDGKGYPDGRIGAEILLEARILAVADFQVAVTSDRPHRPRVERAEGLRRLRAAAGSQLDAALVDLLLTKVLAS